MMTAGINLVRDKSSEVDSDDEEDTLPVPFALWCVEELLQFGRRCLIHFSSSLAPLAALLRMVILVKNEGK